MHHKSYKREKTDAVFTFPRVRFRTQNSAVCAKRKKETQRVTHFFAGHASRFSGELRGTNLTFEGISLGYGERNSLGLDFYKE